MSGARATTTKHDAATTKRIDPWYDMEPINDMWPSSKPPVIQVPGNKRKHDGSKMEKMLHQSGEPEEEPGARVERVTREILYKRWPTCTGCSEEVVIGILIAKRSWPDLPDAVHSAWPFCSECLAMALIQDKEGKCHIPTASAKRQNSLLYLGRPTLAALEMAEREFDFMEDDVADEMQRLQVASMLLKPVLTQSRKRLREP